MVNTIFQYAALNPDTGFLQFKQAEILRPLWRLLFYVHVFTAFFCLLAGFVQFSNNIRHQYPKLHQVVGRVYAYNIIFINAPVGFYLALQAYGGIVSQIAFSLLAILWFSFTIIGVYHARNANWQKHRAFMIRSYALTISALTLRLLKLLLVDNVKLDEVELYRLNSWLAFLISLLAGELIIFFSRHRSTLKSNIS